MEYLLAGGIATAVMVGAVVGHKVGSFLKERRERILRGGR